MSPIRALVAIFCRNSSAATPAPTQVDLAGYRHILLADDRYIKISSKTNLAILTPLEEALRSIGDKGALHLANKFGDGRFYAGKLRFPARDGSGYELAKSTLREIRQFCLDHIQGDYPESIKQPLHCFLSHFPAVVLHPEFTRPIQETASRQAYLKRQPA